MNNRRINTRGIIFKGGEIFAQQLKKPAPDTGNFWCTPGGGLDEGESLFDGLRREMIEETGIETVIGKLLFIQQFHDGNREHLEFFFHIKNTQDYETIDLSKTSHGELEVDSCGFIDPKKENILPAFLQTIAINSYITDNQPVYIDSEL